jgi:hypothetical protein
MRKGWTVEVGDPEKLERQRLEKWKSMSPQDRLDAMIELNQIWRGNDGIRLERTYRIVTVARR